LAIPQFKKTTFGLVTNGTLITSKIIKTLMRYQIQVTVSLDGPKNYHDKFRMFKNKMTGSFDIVCRNIETLTKNDIKPMIQMTISNDLIRDYVNGKFDLLEIVDLLTNLKIKFLHLCPIMSKKDSSSWFNKLDAKNLSHFVRELFPILEKSGIKESSYYKTTEFLQNKICKSGYCSAGTKELTIDINGKIYPCFMFINQENFVLGNIYEGITNHHLLTRLIYNTKGNNKKCSKCLIKDSCTMCIGASFLENASIEEQSMTMCQFSKAGYFYNLESIVNRYSERIKQ
jgi:uncharacterized protein